MKTAEISISSANMSCDDVVKFFQKMKIQSSITSNTSVVCNKTSYHIEKGCNIKFNYVISNELKTIWESVQKEFKLNCAHLKTKDFDGCITEHV
jgi:hypothetical protein